MWLKGGKEGGKARNDKVQQASMYTLYMPCHIIICSSPHKCPDR